MTRNSPNVHSSYSHGVVQIIYIVWVYRSELWKNVSDKDKSTMELKVENDGEFWCGIMLCC